MMTLLIPLGLLGLLSIIALIIIYIIKPNYQQKVISSTFVWKLSLKYRKKRLPVSKLRNILLIICQVLILVSCALILSRPSIIFKSTVSKNEVIAILDSSASMRTEIEQETRYERAVKGVKELAKNVFSEGGTVSIILAEKESSFLAEQVTETGKNALFDELDGLIYDLDDLACSYGSSDIEQALTLCNDVLDENPTTKIYLYTDTKYAFVPEGISVVNVGSEEEWNAAILNANTELEDGYYSLVVDVACYGVDTTTDLHVDINGANAIDSNDTGISLSFVQPVNCSGDETITVIFRNGDRDAEDYEVESENVVYYDISSIDKFYSYKSIHIYFDEYDSFQLDNSYDIYGGQKEVLKVQYASSRPNKFFNAALAVIKQRYEKRWDVQITEVGKEKPALEGFDLYIFEHEMPEVMPTDGVVFLADLNSAPKGSNLRVDGFFDLNKISVSLTHESDHPLLNKIVADDITVSQFNSLYTSDPSYEVLMGCEDYPVMMVKNDGSSKVFVMGFSVHFSNIAILSHFARLFINFFEYFFPATVNGNAFEVSESVILNALSSELYCSGIKEPFTEFPNEMSFDVPGTYTFTQTTYFGKAIEENVYVKIPAIESNIKKEEDGLSSPYKNVTEFEKIDDLLLYFAIALVSLLFVEWLLQAKENF